MVAIFQIFTWRMENIGLFFVALLLRLLLSTKKAADVLKLRVEFETPLTSWSRCEIFIFHLLIFFQWCTKIIPAHLQTLRLYLHLHIQNHVKNCKAHAVADPAIKLSTAEMRKMINHIL